MIEFTKSYKVADQMFVTLAGAQCAAIAALLKGANGVRPEDEKAVAQYLVEHRGEVMEILKQKERVRTRTEKPKRGRRSAALEAALPPDRRNEAPTPAAK